MIANQYDLRRQVNDKKITQKRLNEIADAELKREMIDDIDESINEMLKVVPALKKQADLPAFESRLAQRITGG